MDLDHRSRIHAALGDRHRLAMVDALALSDRTFQELMAVGGLPGNLAAHHLGVLEAAGLIERRVSEGDHRRRYISLRTERLEGLVTPPLVAAQAILFVCTHNSARSQFAAARWRQLTGGGSDSAGTRPATRVDRRAIDVADEYGIDLRDAVPKGYDALAWSPDLVVSVCDRARESGPVSAAPSLHWSVPDPVAAGNLTAFRSAFESIATRIDRLALALGNPISIDHEDAGASGRMT
jgi:protein-tyrosine-phosphatase